MADPVTGELYSERFNFGLDGQRGRIVALLAQAGVEQPGAEVAHLEAVLLDFVMALGWRDFAGPEDQGEDFARGWDAAWQAQQATLRRRLEMVLASRRNLARHGEAGGAAGPVRASAPGGGTDAGSIGDGYRGEGL